MKWVTRTLSVCDASSMAKSVRIPIPQHLVFNIWQQVEHLSVGMTLEPGDCLFTGTPGGVGAAMDPRQFLKAGDVVRCEVDGLGAIEAVMAQE